MKKIIVFLHCTFELGVRIMFSSHTLKSIHFWNSVFSVYENKVLQLMSAGARLERFGEKDLVFIKWRSCRHCSRNLFISISWNSLQVRLCRSSRHTRAQPAQGPKPFIHKSFRLLYVKDEKNKELGGQGKTQVQWRLWWKALIHHFHPRSNDRVSTDLTSRNFFLAPAPLYLPNTKGNSSFRK